MARSGAILSGLLLLAAGLVGAPTAATAAPEQARAATDFITLDSAPDHGPGRGRSLSWSGDEITTVHAAGAFLNLQAEGGRWDWTFRAPEGQRLRPGDYEMANGSMIAGEQPGLLVGGDGSGCNEAHGRFRILELAADLSRIWILYEHRCQNDDPSLAAWGEIRIGMPDVDADTELLPETLRLPDWYPGLDAVPQPLMVFNTGGDDLEISGAEVVAGNADFRVVSGLASCDRLAPRESCRIFVGFRPTTSGQRTGALLLTTSRGPMGVPLTGSGYPGITEFRIDGGSESYVATPDVWTMVGGAAERIVRFTASEPCCFGDRFSIMLQAPERGFEAGRTYSGCCTDVGPAIDLAISGRAVRGEATFTVHEVAYDDAGELRRFSASFRLHNGGGWYLGTVAWRATVPPPMPTTPPESDAAPLTIETDRDEYASGDVARVSVAVPGVAGQEVTLYGSRRYGGPYLVGTATTDTTGRARFDLPLWNETGLSAASGAHAGFADIQVAETPIVAARTSGQVRRKGRFLVFRAGKPARFAAVATMVVGSECLYAQVQRRAHRRWRAVSRKCLTVQELTVAEYRVDGRPAEEKRVRFVLTAAGGRPTAASAWTYLRFIRRAR